MSSIGDRIAKGEEYKSKGNELFKAGKYKSAISKYGTVLAYIRGLPGSKRGLDGVASMINSSQEGVSDITTEQELSTTELEKVTLQNIATCHLKLLNYADALSFCNKAIKLDPKAWKVSVIVVVDILFCAAFILLTFRGLFYRLSCGRVKSIFKWETWIMPQQHLTLPPLPVGAKLVPEAVVAMPSPLTVLRTRWW